MKLEKETIIGQGGLHGRWYEDACAAAFAMELVGERWTLLVMRELMFGARRFSQLRASLPGISARVLTERLERLEEIGALVRCTLPPPASVQVYELTAWGYEAEDLLQVLGRWAVRSPGHDVNLPISSVSAMLSLCTMIDHAAARSLDAVVDFAMEADKFVGRLVDGTLRVARRDAPTPDAVMTFAGPGAQAILPVFYVGVPLAVAERDLALRFTGDRALAERFIALFGLPPKFEPPARSAA